MQIAIYGAKSLALGMYKAVHEIYPEVPCIGFVVNSAKNNPSTLGGLSVIEMEALKEMILPEEREKLHILICTPEDLHEEITAYLEENGFSSYTCMDSRREAKLMEPYFVRMQAFPSLHCLPVQECDGGERINAEIKLQVYQAKFYRDRALKHTYDIPEWMLPIQVGAALTDTRVADICDNTGDNISSKNVNYCELTALYWMWKNRLLTQEEAEDGEEEYYGLFHYRRILDISEDDINRIACNNVDVVVSFPTLHEPDITEHHARYIPESDWEAMRRALEELQPEYASAFADILSQPYMYNYNMLVAKKSVLAGYCAWLFPILERTEALSTPKGWERADRYIGYLGENLMTLYLLYNRERLNIVHTGRLMLT